MILYECVRREIDEIGKGMCLILGNSCNLWLGFKFYCKSKGKILGSFELFLKEFF